jgi:hypothetical protein
MGADFWSGVQAILIPFHSLFLSPIVDTGLALQAATGSQQGKGWCACACCRVVVEVGVGALTTSALIRHSYTHEEVW